MPKPEGWQGVAATWHIPGRSPGRLDAISVGDKMELAIPALDQWGIIEMVGTGP